MGIQIATPPIFDTDIPTSEQFFTKTISGDPVPAHNFAKRYASSAYGIIGMDNAPTGHGLNHQGVWALLLTLDGSAGGDYPVRLAYHDQSGVVTDYEKGWVVKDPAIVTPEADIIAVGHYSYGLIAAQRLGNYVYAVANASRTLGSNPDPFGFPTHFDVVGDWKIVKVGPSQSVTLVEHETYDTRGEDPAVDGTDRPPIAGITPSSFGPGLRGHRTELFVSDDATPFIWHTAGDIQFDFATDYTSVVPPNVWITGWSDNGSGVGTWKFRNDGITIVSGQSAAYLQHTKLPPKQYGFGPYLVFPWESGNYGAPECWYFLMVGGNGSTFDVYRSKWGRGNYVRWRDLIIADDTAFMNKNRQFPAGNPEGWAFDSNWYVPRNKIGRIGPFPGAVVWNKVNGTDSNVPDGILYPYFKVMRDRKRIGQMHTVFGDGKPIAGPSE